MKPKALLFDVFGTVVNWRLGITRDITTHFQNHPYNHASEVTADAWRAQYQSSMEPIRSGRRGYVDLDTPTPRTSSQLQKCFTWSSGHPKKKSG